MAILEERGLFWWDTGELPEQVIAPDPHVAGVLKIEDDGRTILELDGYFPNERGAAVVMEQRELAQDKRIQGVLRDSNKNVLLLNLTRSGGRFSTGALSYDRFLASYCLVSDARPVRDRKLKFKQIVISLDGFEEWLRLGGLKSLRGRRVITVKYTRSPRVRYQLDRGSLTIEYALGGQLSGAMFGASATMRPTAALTFRHTDAQTIEAISTEHQLLEDLFLLLTGTPYSLAWPELRVSRTESHTLYFMKVMPDTKEIPPKYHECVTNYVQLRSAFGSIWSRWKKSREELGPGIYFYLGARKRSTMYVEHRFVNLVWGLEAFHRRKSSTSLFSRLQAKIDRIVAQVALSKDRKWLEKKLENAHEPALEERLFQTLNAVPLGFETVRLRKFAADCARLRNDISHFGESRRGRSYNEFILDTAAKADALSTLYHMLLLNENGVDPKILKWWVFQGFKSFPIKHRFVETGLLDKGVLKRETKESG